MLMKMHSKGHTGRWATLQHAAAIQLSNEMLKLHVFTHGA